MLLWWFSMQTVHLLLTTDSNAATATSGLGMLSAHLDAPVVTKTTVGSDLLQALDVLAQGHVEVVGKQLRVLAGLDVLLSVQEPVGDLELARVLDDGHGTLDLLVGELASTLVEVDIGLLADEVGKATANTLDGGEGEHHLVLAINVGVENTQNVLEFLVLKHQRHDCLFNGDE